MKKTLSLLFLSFVLILPFSHAQVLTAGGSDTSSAQEDPAQSSYVYDLKRLIKKSRDNIKKVNEKIKEQAVLKRNQQREERAREYYQQAQKLAEEGRLDASRELYEKAIRITEHPEMRYYIKESERRAKAQASALSKQQAEQVRRTEEEERTATEKAESAYEAAVTLYKQQKYKEAREEFLAIEQVWPDYKAVRSYLQIVEQDIAQAERLALKEQSREIERQSKEEEIARLREKELWRKEIEQKEVERKKMLKRQAQEIYDEAVRLYQERRYVEAKGKFQEVAWVLPDFKATLQYLRRVDKDIEKQRGLVQQQREEELEKQRWEEELAKKKALEIRQKEKLAQAREQADFVYQGAVALFDKGQTAQAQARFEEVEGLCPDYKSTRDYLRKIDDSFKPKEERDALKKAEQEHQKRLELQKTAQEADSLYKEAFDLYKTGQLIEAKQKFLEVDQKIPDYQMARTYLKKIDDDINRLVELQRKGDTLARREAELAHLKEVRDQADKLYNEALVAYENKDYVKAKAGFRSAENVFPDFKKASYYLNRIDDDIRLQEEALARQALENRTETVYRQATSLYDSEQFEDAKKKFLEVSALIPDYKRTIFYLERVDDDIIRKKEATLNELRSRKADAAYQQALALYQAREFTAAKERFLEADTAISGYKDVQRYLKNIDDDIEKKRREDLLRVKTNKAETIYQEALTLYRNGEFLLAKEKFIQVEIIYPDYKDVPKYFATVDFDIERKKQVKELERKAAEAEGPYNQALDLYRDEEFAEAYKKFLQVQFIYPDYKDTLMYIARAKDAMLRKQEREEREERLRKAEALYGEAMALYRDQEFEEAKAKFIELAGVEPNYKNGRSYLARIDRDILEQKQSEARRLKENKAEGPYAEAVELYHQNAFQEAAEKFRETAQILPGYKKTVYYLRRIDGDIRRQRIKEEKARKAKAEKLYRNGVVLFRQGGYVEAVKVFYQVQGVYPDYKGTRDYLDRAADKIAQAGLTLPVMTEVVPPEEENRLPKEPKSIGVKASELRHEKVVKQDPGKEVRAEKNRHLEELYIEGVKLYTSGNHVKAEKKFNEIRSIAKDYKSTEEYLSLIRKFKQQDVEVPSRKDITAEARVVQELSKRSAELYRQIQGLAEDGDVTGAAKTFAQVDKVIENLQANHERWAAEIARQEEEARKAVQREAARQKEEAAQEKRKLAQQREQLKRDRKERQNQIENQRQAELAKKDKLLKREQREEMARIKEQEKELQLKTDVFYQQGVRFFRKKNFTQARDRFTRAVEMIPGYKDCDVYLMRLDKAAEEEKVMAQESKDHAEIARLVQKASDINLEIVALSEQKNFPEIKAKFAELEGLLKEIQIIKGRIQVRRDDFNAVMRGRAVARMSDPGSIKQKQLPEGQSFREKAKALYYEGEQLYKAGQLPEARIKFLQAVDMDPSLRAAISYLKRVDRLLSDRDYEEKKKAEGAVVVPPLPVKVDIVDEDVERAKVVYKEGTGLYRAKRYREAHIKFEEMYKVGNPAQKKQARRYLTLVDNAVQKQKEQEEKAKEDAQVRYLEERRNAVRLSWERDKARRLKKKSSFLMTDKKKEENRLILQELKLRGIEEENRRERRDMLNRRVVEAEKMKKKERLEEKKFKKSVVVREEVAAADPKVAKMVQERTVEWKAREAQERKERIREARQKVLEDRKKARLAREEERRKKKQEAEERARALKEQLSAEKEKKEKALEEARKKEAEEKEAARKEADERAAAKQEEEKRQVQEKEAQEKETQKKAAIKVDVPAVDAGLLVPPPEETLVPLVSAEEEAQRRAMEQEKERLRLAMEEERKQLSAQREAIRKDFEAGVERLYGEALTFYKKRLYEEAKRNFLQVKGLIDGYKKTDYYLNRIEGILRKKTVAARKMTSEPAKSRDGLISHTLDNFGQPTEK